MSFWLSKICYSVDLFCKLASAYYLKDNTSIEEVIRRWVEDGAKAEDDSMPVWYSPEELWPYREYNWNKENSRAGEAEWDELEANLKARGWDVNEPLYLSVGKNGIAKVSEGNHRLAIARKINLSKVPVFINFGQKVELLKGPGPIFREQLPEKTIKKTLENPKTPRDIPPDEQYKIDELMNLLGLK